MPLTKRGLDTAAQGAPSQQADRGVMEAPKPPSSLSDSVKKTGPASKNGDTMSKADWHDKDVRISRQGLFQAALQSTGLLQLNSGNTFEDYMKLVEQTAERGLEFVNRR